MGPRDVHRRCLRSAGSTLALATIVKNFTFMLAPGQTVWPIQRFTLRPRDALLMVVRRGKTSYASIDHAVAALDRNKLLGVVFNDVRPMLFHTYHKFGYYYDNQDHPAESKIPRIRSPRRNYLES